MFPRFALASIVLAALLVPAAVRAQACFGIPTVPTQSAFQAGIALRERDDGFEVAFRHDARGPLALGGRVEADGVDAIGADVDWELLGGPSYGCPFFGIEFADVHGVEQIRIPLGIGLATGLAADGLRLRLFAVPQVWIVHRDGDRRDDEETDAEGAAEIGLTLAATRLYGRLAVKISSTPDDRVLIGGGVLF